MKRYIVMTMCILLFIGAVFTGCARGEEISQYYEPDNQIPEIEEQILREEPWRVYEMTENINKQMESITAMDVADRMRLGWSLGNSLDARNDKLDISEKPESFEKAWGNPVTKQETMAAVVAAGFNVIRIPVSWTGHFDEDYNIDPAWMQRVHTVVDYAYSQGVYVIIDAHHENWNYPYYDNKDSAIRIMKKLWAQIAEEFKDYDEHLIFEGQNEPRKVGTELEWTGGDAEGREVVNATNAAFVETIRNSGGSNPYRILMIPTYAASSETEAIEGWEGIPGDNRIIASVHAYIPYHFALDINNKPKLTWDNDTADIDRLMKDLKTNFVDKGIPVVLGEFGAVNRNLSVGESDDSSKDENGEQSAGTAENEDGEAEALAKSDNRLEWAKYYIDSACGVGVPCIWWDNNYFNTKGENFGLLNRWKTEWEFPELLEVLMQETAGRAPEGSKIFSAEEYRDSLEGFKDETDN
ncbi:MAG: glycoside hydrolase family 5 protein [Lachnospiraceae bacterium]|nr:glycoside hydrolase family 5 protein [Lachnospiraceae bacterium]